MKFHDSHEEQNPTQELAHVVRTHALYLESIIKRNSRSHRVCLYKLTAAAIDFMVLLHQTRKKWDGKGG